MTNEPRADGASLQAASSSEPCAHLFRRWSTRHLADSMASQLPPVQDPAPLDRVDRQPELPMSGRGDNCLSLRSPSSLSGRVHHITRSINSNCHFFGSRPFDTEDESTNVFGWRCRDAQGLAQPPRLPTVGLFTGCAGTNSTPSGWLILAMARPGSHRASYASHTSASAPSSRSRRQQFEGQGGF
jgi:hypothetical protein